MDDRKPTKNRCVLCCVSDPSIPYFRFPPNETRRHEWLKSCNISRVVHSSAKLCVKHFADDSFTKSSDDISQRRRLKVDAIPTLFLNDISLPNNERNVKRTSYIQWCHLCGYQSRADNTSYHRFPKDPKQLNEWLSYCGEKQQHSDVLGKRLCSAHFSPGDFIEYQHTKKRCLKRDAVPNAPFETIPVLNEINEEVVNSVLTESIEECVSPVLMQINEEDVETQALTSSSLDNETTNLILNPNPPITPSIVKDTCDKSCQTDGLFPLNMRANSISTEAILPSTPSINKNCRTPFPLFPRYVGDVHTPHFATPRRAKKTFLMSRNVIESQKKKIACLSRKLRTSLKKIETLNDLIIHLEKKHLISENALENLMVTTPDSLKAIVLRGFQGQKQKFSPELRRFALNLQFYSTKAYSFVRKSFGNLLPHPASLRKYCSTVDMEPGISKEVLHMLQNRSSQSEKPIICHLVLDEISLKEQINHKGDKVYGFVNLGTPSTKNSHENLQKANHALVFLLVALNDSWKVPVAYYLINRLDASERANLLQTTLLLLHDHGVNVHSITYDGAAVNNAMANKLGAIMDTESPKKKFFILHPKTKEKIFIFPDLCHMLKNLRNAFGTTFINGIETPFYDEHNLPISWKHIQKLNEVQKKERLHVANKITDRHIKYNENIMSVRLAAQVLSNSVGDSLTILKEMGHKEFTEIEGTARFCKIINNIFDFNNCRTRYPDKELRQPFRVPLTMNNEKEMSRWAEDQIDYIKKLRNFEGKPLTAFPRKCGFQGMVICLENVFLLFAELHNKYNFEYLLTYKLLQDSIENLFSSIRLKGGFTNNPTPYQFQTALRRIVIHHEVVHSVNANCMEDEISVLHVSSSVKRQESCMPVESDSENDDENVELFNFQNVHIPSDYVKHIVRYISGYIVYKLKLSRSHLSCQQCFDCVLGNIGTSLLTDIKSRGYLMYASESVVALCTHIEGIIRENGENIMQEKFVKHCIRKLESQYAQFFQTDHFSETNHGLKLTRYISKLYLTVRLHHEDKIRNQVNKYIRKVNSKLILFKHQ